MKDFASEGLSPSLHVPLRQRRALPSLHASCLPSRQRPAWASHHTKNNQAMKKIETLCYLLVLSLICLAASCKKEEIKTSLAHGVVFNIKSGEPIPFAKVFLMGNESQINIVDFNYWYIMDSIKTDEYGAFHFDYVIPEDTHIGFYKQKEHYFDYKEVYYPSLPQLDSLRLPLYPKSYLKIRVKDELPFSGYTSMHIPTLLTQEALQVTGNPIDTTVVMWLHDEEALLVDWFYHDTDTTWIHDGGGYVSCPSFDTCDYQIIF